MDNSSKVLANNLQYITISFCLFYIKFILIISRKHKIQSKDLTSKLGAFWYFITSNLLKLIMDISEKRIYYHIFFKNILNKSILINRVE